MTQRTNNNPEFAQLISGKARQGENLRPPQNDYEEAQTATKRPKEDRKPAKRTGSLLDTANKQVKHPKKDQQPAKRTESLLDIAKNRVERNKNHESIEGDQKKPLEDKYYIALMVEAAKEGKLDVVQDYFPRLSKHPNVKVCTLLLGAIARSGNITAAENFFEQMTRAGRVEANDITYSVMIHMYLRNNERENAFIFFKEALEKGYAALHLFHAVLLPTTKMLDAVKAEELFQQISKHGLSPDGFVYRAMIAMYTTLRRTKEVNAYFRQMKQEGVEVHPTTYTNVLKVDISVLHEPTASNLDDRLILLILHGLTKYYRS